MEIEEHSVDVTCVKRVRRPGIEVPPSLADWKQRPPQKEEANQETTEKPGHPPLGCPVESRGFPKHDPNLDEQGQVPMQDDRAVVESERAKN